MFNQSKIEAQIIFDLRYDDTFDEISCLQLNYIKKEGDIDDAVVSLDKHPDDEGKF